MTECIIPILHQRPKEWLRGNAKPIGLWTAQRHCQGVVVEDLEAFQFVDNNNYSTGEVVGSLWAPVTGGAAIGHRPENRKSHTTKFGCIEESARTVGVGKIWGIVGKI